LLPWPVTAALNLSILRIQGELFGALLSRHLPAGAIETFKCAPLGIVQRDATCFRFGETIGGNTRGQLHVALIKKKEAPHASQVHEDEPNPGAGGEAVS
jgi:hypothetical protein